MRTTQAVVQALGRMDIHVAAAGRGVIDETLRKVGLPIQVQQMPERSDATAIAYVRITEAGLELFLPRRSSELAVIHELLHVLLLPEGYFFPMIWHPEPDVEAAIVAIVGGLIEVATHPQVRRCMESRGLDLRLFHQVQRVVPAMAHGHGEPTPEEEVQLAVTALMQLTEYPALRGEVEREFDEAYPEAARLAGELLGAAEASPVTDPKTFRELLRGMLSLADQHIKRRGGALPLSLYVPLPPICGMVELARPAKDVIRVTDTSVLTILQSDSRPQSTPPAVFLVWKEDNSTVQVRSLAHSSLMLQVKDSLRKQMEQPLEAFLKGLRVPFVAA